MEKSGSNPSYDPGYSARVSGPEIQALWRVLPKVLCGGLDEARDELISRGLTTEHIYTLDYRGIPDPNTRQWRRLSDEVQDLQLSSENLPSLRKSGALRRKMAGEDLTGIVIPQRNLYGHVVGLRCELLIRRVPLLNIFN
jgi:hypothetical protein